MYHWSLRVFKNIRHILITVLLLIVLLTGYVYYNLFLYRNNSEITLYFPYGTPVAEIAKQMGEAQVVGDEKVFIIVAKLAQINGKVLISGEYKFAAGINPYESMLKLVRGERVPRKLTIPEGLTIKAVMKAVNNAPGLLGDITEEVKECNILPETYLYYFGDNKDSIVRAMKDSFNKFMAEAMSVDRSGLNDIDSVIILASIVEKETKVSDERSRIAGVYLNRLQTEMPLQADPTIIYGMSNGLGSVGRDLTRDDLKVYNPYNTYLQKGLPPTAIACPGKASILAVINPERHDYLYFVADSFGGHVFAKSLSEHNKNNITRKARKRELINNSAKKT